MSNGWIKLHTKFNKWEWKTEPNMVALFIHLLLNANWKPGRYQGHKINRGQMVVGRKKLSMDTGISQQTIRTCLERLKSTSEVTIKSTSKFSILTICNYDTYQNNNDDTNQQINHITNLELTSNQPATNHNRRSKDNKNKDKKEKENIKRKRKNEQSCPDDLQEVIDYFISKGVVDPHEKADLFFDHYESVGWKVAGGNPIKDWKRCMTTWKTRGTIKIDKNLIPKNRYPVEDGYDGWDKKKLLSMNGKPVRYCDIPDSDDFIKRESEIAMQKKEEKHQEDIKCLPF